MTDSTVIRLTDISKKYEIHHEKPTLVEKFVRGSNETFWALRNISLMVQRGQRIGILGLNGSGKTTLLKIIAGITTPTSGQVTTKGRVVSLIDLEAGFHSDLTGYQNIYLNALLLGLTRKEVDAKLSRIIAFADIRQFIDAPLYTYSTGMALRLGFAVAVHADPDILILDENISAGDSNFQKKSRRKLQEFVRRKKTIVVVTHQLPFVRQMCNRILVLHHGQIVADGPVATVDAYEQEKYTRT